VVSTSWFAVVAPPKTPPEIAAKLSRAFAEILRESRERYLLSYTPTGVPAGGWHEVIVRVPGRRAEVRARPGYLAP